MNNPDKVEYVGSTPTICTRRNNMVDNTNKQNIKMIFLYIATFFICIVLVAVMSIIFGDRLYDQVSHYYDKPASSYSYHDHRL